MHTRESLLAVRLNHFLTASLPFALVAIGAGGSLHAQVVINAVNSITTSISGGSHSTDSTIAGSSTTMDNYDLSVTGVTDTNGNTYTVTGLATSAIVRTDSTSTGELAQSSAWYMGTAQSCDGNAPDTLYGSYNSGTPASLLLGNNLLEGSDNTFINSSDNGSASTGNIERVDFLYNGTTGVVDTSGLSIGVFDRGTGDSFSVAIITGVDSHGNPTSYGGFVTVSNTAFNGNDSLLTAANSNSAILNDGSGDPTDYLVRYDSSTSLSTNNTTDDTQTVDQNISGVIFTLASLGINSGTTIYGYSLMGGDVTPGTNLNSLTNTSNTSVYQTNTSDTSAFDGLDPVAVNGVLFSMHAVPEPSTYAEVFLVGTLALYGWKRLRQTAKSPAGTK